MNTIGVRPRLSPAAWARRIRKAWLKVARETAAPTAVTIQNRAPRLLSWSQPMGGRALAPPASSDFGSLTPRTSRPTEIAPGITAHQNTARMLFASSAINPMAISGPAKAPTVSSAWRTPKAAPRIALGVTSATRASRGAPRMPLPIRSTTRAASTS